MRPSVLRPSSGNSAHCRNTVKSCLRIAPDLNLGGAALWSSSLEELAPSRLGAKVSSDNACMALVGVESVDELAAVMVGAALLLLLVPFLMLSYMIFFSNRARTLLVEDTLEMPPLMLAKQHLYHLFLSHVLHAVEPKPAALVHCSPHHLHVR